MEQTILKRLESLENHFQMKTAPSWEEWLLKWDGFSDLDKGLFIVAAENVSTMDDSDPYKPVMCAISGYLERMGLLDPEAKTLQQLAAELDNGIM